MLLYCTWLHNECIIWDMDGLNWTNLIHQKGWIRIVLSPRAVLLKRNTHILQLNVPAHCTADMSLIWSGLEGGVFVRAAYCALGFNQCLVFSGKNLTSSLCCWFGWLLELQLHVSFSEKCSVNAQSVTSLTGWDWNSLWVSLCLLPVTMPRVPNNALIDINKWNLEKPAKHYHDVAFCRSWHQTVPTKLFPEFLRGNQFITFSCYAPFHPYFLTNFPPILLSMIFLQRCWSLTVTWKKDLDK